VLTYSVSQTSPTTINVPTVSGTCSDSESGFAPGGIEICAQTSSTCNYPDDFTIAIHCVAGSYEHTFDALDDGAYDIRVVGVDRAGNKSTPIGQGALDYVIDSTAPSLTYAASPESPANANTPSIGGTCADEGTGLAAKGIEICIKSTSCSYPGDYTVAVDCVNGTYNHTSGVLADGDYDIQVVGIDGVGNTSTPVGQAIDYVIDSVAPEPFDISGISSTTDDTLVDDLLFPGVADPSVHWLAATDAVGPVSYRV
jgi:hypothetical protein